MYNLEMVRYDIIEWLVKNCDDCDDDLYEEIDCFLIDLQYQILLSLDNITDEKIESLFKKLGLYV